MATSARVISRPRMAPSRCCPWRAVVFPARPLSHPSVRSFQAAFSARPFASELAPPSAKRQIIRILLGSAGTITRPATRVYQPTLPTDIANRHCQPALPTRIANQDCRSRAPTGSDPAPRGAGTLASAAANIGPSYDVFPGLSRGTRFDAGQPGALRSRRIRPSRARPEEHRHRL